MPLLIVRHQVADYDRWREGYDANEDVRTNGGVRHQMVYRSADDGNDVTVMHDFATVDAARAFAGSPELKAAMDELGVVGAPQVWFVEET